MPIDPTALIDGGIDDYRVLAEQKGLALDLSSEAPKSTLKIRRILFHTYAVEPVSGTALSRPAPRCLRR